MKPIIGVTPLWNSEKKHYWMRTNYMTYIEAAGGIPVMLSLTSDEDSIRQIASQFDGFLFCGGPDINPAYYHEEMIPECGELCPERDVLESALFKEVLKQNKPMFGICRGLQFFNVLLGGSLYQDLKTQYPITVNHRVPESADNVIHKVSILPDTPFSELIPCEEIGVNSRHHQAIKDLAPSLKPGAISEDGLIEAVYMPDHKFLMATQWHPEVTDLAKQSSANISKAFISACMR